VTEVTEKYNYPVKGEWWDVINRRQPDGTIKSEVTPVTKNTIVLPVRTLIASVMKIHAGYTGINFHALGQGDIAWDASLPAATENDSPLTAEEYRKAPTLIEWIDAGTGDPTLTPSRIIRVKTIFDFAEMNQAGVYIREQGLFGGTATATADSGEMVNNIRHKKIWKDKDVELVRYIKLEF